MLTDIRGDADHWDMNNRRIAEFIIRHLNRRRWQPIWERLHAISLNGMGIGSPTLTLAESGELAALKEIVSHLRKQSSGPLICVDVGANAGQYVDLLLQVLPDDAVTLTFEPSSAAFEQLAAKCRSHPRVHPRHLALGAAAGTVTLYAPSAGDVNGSTLVPRVGEASAEAVPMDTLDAVCEREGIHHVHYLKIDTEGTELDVLKGAHRLLEHGAIDAIQWEFGFRSLQAGSSLADFLLLLSGYRVFRVVGDGLQPLRYTPRMEIYYSCTNYVALR